MKALRIILYVLLSIAALVVIMGLFARHNYHIERSIEIKAPRALVMEQVKYFKNFQIWSPWGTLDPNMKTSIEGADGTVGAVYKWDGNKDVGAGRQTIKSITDSRVEMEVKFTKPWESSAPTFFQLDEIDAEKTKISWGFDMYIGFPWNGLAMLTDVDAGVGKDYIRGLDNLKKVCEDIAHPKFRGYEIAEAPTEVQYYVGIRRTIKQSELAEFYAEAYPKLFEAVQKSGATMTGSPASLTYIWDDSTHTTDIAAVIPIAKAQKIDTFTTFTINPASALHIDYFGQYDSIGTAHMAMDDYMKKKMLQMIPPAIEQYITDPKAEPDTSKWLTKLIYLVEPKR